MKGGARCCICVMGVDPVSKFTIFRFMEVQIPFQKSFQEQKNKKFIRCEKVGLDAACVRRWGWISLVDLRTCW